MLLNSNTKLKKDKIHKFSMPVGKTCIGAGACLEFCYGKKGMYKIHEKRVSAAHKRNFEASKKENFVEVISKEIQKRRKISKVRIHDTGDFYSQDYLKKWVQIARLNPQSRFYAYTKSFAKLDFSEFLRQKNTKIIQSFGSVDDDKINLDEPHARIFPDAQELSDSGYINCSSSDLVALNAANPRIGLIAH